MKNKAFTLAEILIVLMIMGFLILVMIKNLKTNDFSEKEMLATGQKAIQVIEQGFAKIKSEETTNCPTHNFMHKVGGTYELTLYGPDGKTKATAENIIDLLSNHLKTSSSGFDFCAHTSFCDENSTNIIGMKVPENIYIGIEILSSIQNCPAYKMPDSNEEIPAPTAYNNSTSSFETERCWGKAYIDINGEKGPDTLGKDVFVFGLSANGVAR